MSWGRPGREDFEDLPPSCRAVIRELQRAGGDLSRQELRAATGHSDSTMTDALRHLENRHWILRTRKSEDLTQVSVELRYSPDL